MGEKSTDRLYMLRGESPESHENAPMICCIFTFKQRIYRIDSHAASRHHQGMKTLGERGMIQVAVKNIESSWCLKPEG
jgi:hypothetical protein